MTNRVKLCLQVAWLTTALVALVMNFNLCAATDQACNDAGGRMFLMMVVLSFPAGIFCVVVALFVFEFLLAPASAEQLNDYFLFWWIMTAAGYLQWFVVAPKLFAEPKFTTLGLNPGSKVETAPPLPAPTNTEEAPRDTRLEPAAPQVPKPRRVRPIRAYDKRGRTPLERALWSNSTGASA